MSGFIHVLGRLISKEIHLKYVQKLYSGKEWLHDYNILTSLDLEVSYYSGHRSSIVSSPFSDKTLCYKVRACKLSNFIDFIGSEPLH